ncbi:VWA domain-containing protein [Ancylobacter sp. 6x-1]|uniref:VWA domain-containing protein n=1 Tax=Ancylobacter crimeensis TaxID=2579147 RepID=A0ABT0DGF0_9HYPH|nr:VWA domain-containing protein [Ancylobacter crimeensis]MCK0198812.1 VWA domain-containing protein [Ancylobacter crimeensis]
MSGAAIPAGGKLADNIAYFARALRAAGLPVGPGMVLDAVTAVEAAGIGPREDFYWTLHAVFVTRRDQHLVFDQAFPLFWQRRRLDERLIALMSPTVPAHPNSERAPLRRIEDALFAGIGRQREARAPSAPEVEARLTVSAEESFRVKDFAQMNAAEIDAVRRQIARLALPREWIRTRRQRPDPRGTRLDLRATLRASLRSGGDLLDLRRRGPVERLAPLVLLIDISGSMAEYSRPLLHFAHALTEARRDVSTFLFGTRLTNVTRALARRDPDEALEGAGRSARDWSGGTRIATSLAAFNRFWSRRVLGGKARVLLMTDGLERETADGNGPSLAFETDRLRRSCARLIWLNPLLRYEYFEARAAGVKAMLPHVDDFRPVHNLASIEALVAALSRDDVDVSRDNRAPRRNSR